MWSIYKLEGYGSLIVVSALFMVSMVLLLHFAIAQSCKDSWAESTLPYKTVNFTCLVQPKAGIWVPGTTLQAEPQLR